LICRRTVPPLSTLIGDTLSVSSNGVGLIGMEGGLTRGVGALILVTAGVVVGKARMLVGVGGATVETMGAVAVEDGVLVGTVVDVLVGVEVSVGVLVGTDVGVLVGVDVGVVVAVGIDVGGTGDEVGVADGTAEVAVGVSVAGVLESPKNSFVSLNIS